MRVLFLHILPNIVGPLTVVATLEFGLMVLFEAGLSFLGLGVQPPTASWGAMLSVGRNYVANAFWIATFPGICLFLLILSVNLIGDRAARSPGSKIEVERAMNFEREFEGKSIVVTGACGLYGRRVVEVFVEEGARICLTDRDAGELRMCRAACGCPRAASRTQPT